MLLLAGAHPQKFMVVPLWRTIWSEKKFGTLSWEKPCKLKPSMASNVRKISFFMFIEISLGLLIYKFNKKETISLQRKSENMSDSIII